MRMGVGGGDVVYVKLTTEQAAGEESKFYLAL